MHAKFIYAKIIKHSLTKELILISLFGTFSYVFGLVKIQVPGLEGTVSDLREIPLLIGIFYLSNPISLIAASGITALGALSIGSFWPTLFAHAISLIISWYYNKYQKKLKFNNNVNGILWILYISIYYLVLLLPLLILFNTLFGLNSDITFFTSLKHLIFSARFEILSTALITSIYLVQFRIQNDLKEHKRNLEFKVKKRTEEFETANEELKYTNEELLDKSTIIKNQNTELIATMRYLKETQSQLVQSEKMASLGILTAGVAHEINNPLNFIVGGIGGLESYFEEKGKLPKKVQILLSTIQTGADRASNIIKGLNQLSRSNDKFDEDCDIRSIINNCLLIMQSQLKDKIEINTVFKNESFSVNGNMGKLHQVFINILTNSIQAIKHKGNISITTQNIGKNIIIEIEDTGSGINKKHLSKITDPFYTTKDPGKGTGLGLSISYSIIKEHKGSLNFQSEFDKGTTVIITLPLKKKQ